MNNSWTATGDFLYIKRTSLNNKTIVRGPDQRLGTKQALDRFDFEPGYRIGLQYHLNVCNTFEASFSHITEWSADHEIKGSGNLYVPFYSLSTGSDYYNASLAREVYTSEFDSGEINWWYHFTPRRVNYFSLSSILGLRALRVDEHFTLAMTKGANTSHYKVSTENSLWGGHLGASLQGNPTDNFSWEILGKAGAFYNDLENRRRARDFNDTTSLGKERRDGSQTTFLGEAALVVSYQFGCYFNLHLGYQFLYLTGLALAPRQFTLDNVPTLRNRLSKNGEIILHGAFAGINLSF